MDMKEIANWVARSLPGLICKQNWGETAWFYNPGGYFANGDPFLAITMRDRESDTASRLDRVGVWRLSFHLPRAGFEAHFGTGGADDCAFDALDRLTPHPDPRRAGWAAINAPSRRRFETLKPLLRDAHRAARAGFETRFGAAA